MNYMFQLKKIDWLNVKYKYKTIKNKNKPSLTKWFPRNNSL